jgi:proline racemase
MLFEGFLGLWDCWWLVQPSWNVCIFAEREIDRSPTGSGVTARMAVRYARVDRLATSSMRALIFTSFVIRC